MTSTDLLRVRDLSVQIGAVTVCTGWNWELAAGQCWALLGRNGAGKTTLLHTLAGVQRANAGGIELQDQPLTTLTRKHVARQMGLLPQDFQDMFPGTVLETALIGRHPHLSAWRWEGAEDVERARHALAEVDLAELEGRDISTLSGGERRRLGLATLMCQDPRVFLLDEPTNHLDVRHQHATLALMKTRIEKIKCSAVMSLHDINLARRYCDHAVLLMGDGQIISGAVDTVMTTDNLSRLYEWPLCEIETATGQFFVPD